LFVLTNFAHTATGIWKQRSVGKNSDVLNGVSG